MPGSLAGWIYIIYVREFLNLCQNIFKIGRTRNIIKRFKQYPNGSVLILSLQVDDMFHYEKELKSIFKEKYNQRTDIGTEYFEGNVEDMIQSIILYKQTQTKLEIAQVNNVDKTNEVVESLDYYDIIESDLNNYITLENITKNLQETKPDVSVKDLSSKLQKLGLKIGQQVIGKVCYGVQFKDDSKNTPNISQIILSVLEKDFDITRNADDFVTSAIINEYLQNNNIKMSSKKIGSELKLLSLKNDQKRLSGKTLQVWFGIKKRSNIDD